MAGLDPAIQAVTLPVETLRSPWILMGLSLDARVKPGHDAERDDQLA
jgi:hypothetical protein